MQLAPSAPTLQHTMTATSVATPATPAHDRPTWSTEPPVYVGLRVSADREFSAPMYADKVHTLRAGELTGALAEARDLLAKGSFNGTADAAKAVVLLAEEGSAGPDGEAPVTTFRAGSLVELRMGMPRPVSDLPRADARWEFWYEPTAVAVLDADDFELTH